MKIATCKIEGCEAAYPGHKGYCAKHYQRLRKYGDPLISRNPGWLPGDPNNPSKSPEARSRISRFRKGVPLSKETRRKQSETMRLVLARPEMREKWRRAATGRKLAPATIEKLRAAKRAKPKKMSSMMHGLDSAFSRYVRLKYADAHGYVQCVTCHEKKLISEMDCGHYVSRQHKALRWDLRNAHPQCRACNRFHEGRKDVYALWLLRTYGANILHDLESEKHKIVHVNEAFYLEKTDEWKALYAALQAEREAIGKAYLAVAVQAESEASVESK